jgi:hypothetical protein
MQVSVYPFLYNKKMYYPSLLPFSMVEFDGARAKYIEHPPEQTLMNRQSMIDHPVAWNNKIYFEYSGGQLAEFDGKSIKIIDKDLNLLVDRMPPFVLNNKLYCFAQGDPYYKLTQFDGNNYTVLTDGAGIVPNGNGFGDLWRYVIYDNKAFFSDNFYNGTIIQFDGIHFTEVPKKQRKSDYFPLLYRNKLYGNEDALKEYNMTEITIADKNANYVEFNGKLYFQPIGLTTGINHQLAYLDGSK